MSCYISYDESRVQQAVGHRACLMLGPEQGCTGLCASGISIYESTRYAPFQSHPFQEGFYVISGTGFASVGGEEFPIREGMCFLAAAGKAHSLRADSAALPVRVLWFHSA